MTDLPSLTSNASSICIDCGGWRPVPALRRVSALCPPCRDTRAEKARADQRRRERERGRAAVRTHRPEYTR